MQSRPLTTLREKPSESITGKEENAENQHFLLLSQCFLTVQDTISISESHLHFPSTKSLAKMLSLGEQLTLFLHMPVLGASISAADNDMMS